MDKQQDPLVILIESMAKGLVDGPDMVSVSTIPGDQTTVYELRVAKRDQGKVIGKQGKNASAMRTILNAAATKVGKRVILEIMETKE